MKKLVISMCAVFAPVIGVAGELTGRVDLHVAGGALRAAQSTEAVVYFRPERRVAPTVPPTEFQMLTVRKRFEPQTLTIPVGATVRFPNGDPILHNVFSTSGANRFDLGYLARGHGRAMTFVQPGLVRVYCNVHHQMTAHILVLDTPYVARPDGQGQYRLKLPGNARGELFIWHPRSPLWRKRINASGDLVLNARIELNRPLVPPHGNKFGRPYEREAGHGY